MFNKKTVFCITATLIISACGEPSSTQRDYIDARDECREISELKLTPDVRAQAGGAEYKRELLIGFRDCMQKKGWSVTAPKRDAEKRSEEKYGQAPVPVRVEPLQPPPQTAENPDARRAAECAYARSAVNHSSNARAIAKGCDLECANFKRLSPDMPPPPACAP